jgi:hypothetical protein
MFDIMFVGGSYWVVRVNEGGEWVELIGRASSLEEARAIAR